MCLLPLLLVFQVDLPNTLAAPRLHIQIDSACNKAKALDQLPYPALAVALKYTWRHSLRVTPIRTWQQSSGLGSLGSSSATTSARLRLLASDAEKRILCNSRSLFALRRHVPASPARERMPVATLATTRYVSAHNILSSPCSQPSLCKQCDLFASSFSPLHCASRCNACARVDEGKTLAAGSH